MRRIRFAFPSEDAHRHYVSRDVLSSHLVTLGSAVFPEGEDFFVRTVRRFRDQITDPVLKAQVQGFIGQEANHGRAHRELNRHLGRLGYPTGFIDRFVLCFLWLCERLLPPRAQLGITAALEHFTATLAEVLLTDPEARAQIADDEIRNLFLWHSLEESEHKAVAFDVFRAVGGSERLRIRMMRVMTFLLAIGTVGGLVVSLAKDRAAFNPRRMRASIRTLSRSPLVSRRVGRRLREYNRRGFHPADYDNSALVQEWREKLFATGGTLARAEKGVA